MTQAAQYVATVRKVKVITNDFMGALFFAGLIEDWVGSVAKITKKTSPNGDKIHTVWEVEPRRKAS